MKKTNYKSDYLSSFQQLVIVFQMERDAKSGIEYLKLTKLTYDDLFLEIYWFLLERNWNQNQMEIISYSIPYI